MADGTQEIPTRTWVYVNPGTAVDKFLSLSANHVPAVGYGVVIHKGYTGTRGVARTSWFSDYERAKRFAEDVGNRAELRGYTATIGPALAPTPGAEKFRRFAYRFPDEEAHTWTDYPDEANGVLSMLYLQGDQDRVRFPQAGAFVYRVDLDNHTQKNIVTGDVRVFREVKD